MIENVTTESIMVLLPITGQVCWYYSAYMLLMVFSPFLNYGIDSIPIKKFKYLLIIMMTVCYVGNFIFHRDSTSFILLLFIYMLGRYINKSKFEIASTSAIAAFLVSSTLLAFVVGVAARYRGAKLVYEICNNYNPFLIFSAVCLFFAFKNSSVVKGLFGRLCVSVSSSLFAVYVVHVLVLHLGWKIFIPLSSLNPYIHVVILSIVTLFLICLLEIFRKSLTRRFETKCYLFIKSKIK